MASKSEKIKSEKKYFGIPENKLIWVAPLLALVIYLPAFQHEFVSFDDLSYYSNYKPIQELNWENIKTIWTVFHKGNYHPLTTSMWAVEYALFGDNPYPLHIINVLLHLLNTVLVFKFVQLLCKRVGVAFFTALLFAVHPMHVESVAWMSERKDVLYTCFLLLSLIQYLKYRDQNRNLKFLYIAAICFALSLFSKSAAVVIPVLMLLIDFYQNGKFVFKDAISKIPLLALSVLFGVMAIKSQGASGAIQEIGGQYDMMDRPMLASYGLSQYMFKLFLPFKLTCFYPYPPKVDGHFPAYFWGYLALAVSLVTIMFYFIKRIPAVFFGIAFFFISIFLVLQLLPVGGAIMADRYTYVPYIGLFIAGGMGIDHYLAKRASQRKVVLIGALVFSGFLSWLCFNRVKDWKNSETLWTSAIENYPNELSHNNRAFYYNQNEKYDLAMKDINKALKYNPNYFKAWNNRGMAHFKTGNLDEALKDYNRSLEINSGDKDTKLSRANVLSSKGMYAESIPDYDNYLASVKDNQEAWFYRGTAFRKTQNLEKAVSDFSMAINLDKQYFDATFWRGISYFELKQHMKAIEDFNMCLKLRPNDSISFYNRSLAWYGLEKWSNALSDANTARSLGYNVHPDYFRMLNEKLQGNS